MPVIVLGRRTPPAKRPSRLDRVEEPLDLLDEAVEVSEDHADDERAVRLERSLARLAKRWQLFARSLPPASSARTSGSVVPETSASSIARADASRMSLATQSSLS